jgi:hypothetical protein
MNNDNILAKALLAQSQQKSSYLGFILGFAFGGFGLLYASIVGGIIMSILEIIALILTFVTFGFGLILLIPLHLITAIWALASINSHNKKVLQEVLAANS